MWNEPLNETASSQPNVWIQSDCRLQKKTVNSVSVSEEERFFKMFSNWIHSRRSFCRRRTNNQALVSSSNADAEWEWGRVGQSRHSVEFTGQTNPDYVLRARADIGTRLRRLRCWVLIYGLNIFCLTWQIIVHQLGLNRKKTERNTENN